MDKLLRKPLKKYYHQIRKRLPYIPHKRKKEFIMSLKAGIENFQQENNDVSMEKVYKHFGTVEELTEIYLENVSQKDLSKYIVFNKIFKCTCASLVIFFISGCIYFIHTTQSSVVTEAEVQTEADAAK